MRTSEELFKEIDNVELTKQEVIERLREFQDEAYNEAIRDAAKNAKTKNTQVVMYPNQTNSYTVGGIEVDKDSILNLLKP